MNKHTKIIPRFSLLLFVILQACTGSKVTPSDTLNPEPTRETAAPQVPSATPTLASSEDAENTPTAGPTPVQFTGMITVPNDPNLIPYPDFYLEASDSSVGISDPYCAISSETVSYPKEYLGDFPLPSLRGGPLPPEIRRGVGLVDVWGCCLNMPSLNFGCEASMHDAYLETLRRIAQLGADHIAISNYVFIQDVNAASPQFSSESLQITESEMAFLTEQARNYGLDVFLYINVPFNDFEGNQLPYTPEPDWYAAYMDEYVQFVVEQAKLAERYGIQAMMLNNFDYEIDLSAYQDIVVSKLVEALDQVRSVYTGKVIVYDGLYGVDTSLLDGLFSQADIILSSIQGTEVLLNDAENTRISVELMTAKYRDHLTQVAERLGKYDKPVMFRILLQAHRNFFQTGYIPDVAFCTENCTQLDIETDFSVQAIGYEAFFEALSEIHGNGINVYSTDAYWYWYTDTMLPLNNFPNISHSIRNKPAESVVYYWFSR